MMNSLSIQGVHFSTEQYTDALYPQHQVIMPESVRKAVTKRKAEFLAGRIAAQAACSAYYSHLLLPQILLPQIGIGPLRGPLWPAGINGSITHCHLPSGEGIALAACGPCNKLIGIDAEVIFSPQLAAETAEQFVDETERALIQSAQITVDYHVAMTAVFSAKESFFKAVAPVLGFYFDFDAIKLIKIEEQQLSFEIVDFLSEPFHAGIAIDIDFMVIDNAFVITSLCMNRPETN